MVKGKNIGSTLESFLKEEGNYEEARSTAIKRVISWQLQETMKKQHISKSEMARRMNTSRAQLYRLLDPENDKVQLDTLYKAASAVGKELHLELV
ncbi:MAG: Fis family transcriptional regulator [Candidatus Scalindua sp. AMX11]|nr:XRE family transcriptional regulator [Planctomycetota bacterium]RZV61138.1 MAG: Fis family transcriptional regulator [Candidatus Scalindua sp. SCAELEC01]TDE63171.1 MAG: Fis family transcriptional regulator [Candidatus Scalindua sp. AMX11]GJQ57411.1 MAG: Fis family transcriptional regulator [Candidatus Scalindua sp.]